MIDAIFHCSTHSHAPRTICPGKFTSINQHYLYHSVLHSFAIAGEWQAPAVVSWFQKVVKNYD